MLYIRLAIFGLILGLGATAYIYYLKYQNVAVKLEQVERINKENARVMRELQIDMQIERELTKKELAEAQKRASAIDQVEKELQNVPGANDPVHPYFNELGDRLRSLNSGTAD